MDVKTVLLLGSVQDGASITLDSSISMLRATKVGAADITAEKQTQEELRQALLFRERMIGVLGHDLRNPLSAASIAIHRLHHTGDLSEDARTNIERIDPRKQAKLRLTSPRKPRPGFRFGPGTR